VFKELMSGTRADRPQLAAALEFARDGDVLVVARLDRLARSMRQLLTPDIGLASTCSEIPLGDRR
jgi:DNA invertase Pin-like site-specific DNA recombinase